MTITFPDAPTLVCRLARGQETALSELQGSPAEVNRSEQIRESALCSGAKLLSQVEASKANADRTGQLTQYWHVHNAMTDHILQLRAELHAEWWIAHFAEYADDRCWKETLRAILIVQDEWQCSTPA